MNRSERLVVDVAKLWAPPKELSVSQWADKNFYLSPEYAAEHGRWLTLPFQREPLDATGDPRIWQTVIKSCTQLLKTTVIQISTAYEIDQDPGPILIIQPRDADAKSFSKERIAPMLRDVPCLAAKVSDSKAKKSDNTIEEKWFKGGLLAITSAGSPGNLARRAIRSLKCDEENKWVLSSGAEGKPFSLALKRTATFRHRRRVIRCCSPTAQGDAIDLAYQDSDRREFYVPCPACGHKQSMMLKFRSQVRWTKVAEDGKTPLSREEQARTARYHCENPDCDAQWDDAARLGAVEQGEWLAHAQFNGIAGFWISELYSPWKQLGEIVLDYLMKKDNPEDLKTFINTSLAENWIEPGETLEWERLVERREDYAVSIVPKGGLFLTIGVDVQREEGGRLECEIVAWGENRESWSVDYRVIYGDPAQSEVWNRLEELLHETFPHESGGELGIERMFVDSGDGTTTREVYEWVQKQPRPRVWAIKGDRRGDQPVSGPRATELNNQGKKTKYGTLLRIVNVDYFKAGFYADLRKRKPTDEEIENGLAFPQGFCHFPKDGVYGDEHFRQICNEQLVTHRGKNGRTKTEWRQLPGRNEALDARIYAMAGAWDFGVHKFQPRHWEMLSIKLAESALRLASPKAETPKPAELIRPAPAGDSWIPQRSWFNR
jgi:phage terminase large subunit GpA-like protein